MTEDDNRRQRIADLNWDRSSMRDRSRAWFWPLCVWVMSMGQICWVWWKYLG